ncbi:putative mitochondrial inner membrane protein 1 protein [Erysiphe neolycopersici]|uniref:Putative mitochondrial inner membrane protein 1 protein n=1 Tax=Erysiphe neolycopersici TaxID=212602 RepID=A0A420HM82_9PEZI|nr:putative mitochondrial inner membrane protein 1 protein [Erysiphe neolycopersici]
MTKAYSTANHASKDNVHTKEDEIDMYKSIRSELVTIKDTFSLKDVPKDSLYIGAAGILPYAATSCSTIYLAWDINYAEENGFGYLLSPETAHQILDIITPIQIGYGAIIISFLGAVHWGLEYAGFGGKHSYRRLKYGVIAPIIAWPTLLVPVETALISQFIAFNYMYFVDARATVKGWFPPWYSIYRFVLTFFVGASIVSSLISRGQIVRPEQHQLRTLKEQAIAEREAQFVNLESEENARREAREAAGEESENDEESEEENENENEED